MSMNVDENRRDMAENDGKPMECKWSAMECKYAAVCGSREACKNVSA
jgi:hypothetical protein